MSGTEQDADIGPGPDTIGLILILLINNAICLLAGVLLMWVVR